MSRTRTWSTISKAACGGILDYCGLPFEPACVASTRPQRSVRTPSSEQVRQPIFRDGLDAWHRYEPWLGPLQDALGDALERYRD